MAAEVLRRGVEHDVRPQLERPLERGRRERVVDDEQRPRPPACAARSRTIAAEAAMSVTLSSGFDGVSSQTRRVALGERPPTARPGPPARSTYRASRRAGRPVDALEVAERAAVDVVADEDLLARRRELGDGRRRRRAAGERDAVAAALEVRHRALEALAGRVLAAGVLVAAAWPPDAVLGEGRRLVDRRRDRAGQPRPARRRRGPRGSRRRRAGPGPADRRRACRDHRIDTGAKAGQLRRLTRANKASPDAAAIALRPSSGHARFPPGPPETDPMPHVASTSATSLALAHDRADRDRQVAADWRRRRTQPDAAAGDGWPRPTGACARSSAA